MGGEVIIEGLLEIGIKVIGKIAQVVLDEDPHDIPVTVKKNKPEISMRAKKRIQKAARIINNGGLVAFPTETVYGLGADAFNAQAVERIYTAKGRPGDNPLILHIATIEQFMELAEDLPYYVASLIDVYWPGPLTLIAKKKSHLPSWVGGHPQNNTDTIGVRMPSHPVAKAFLMAAGCPVAAPSANKSGRPSPTTSQHVKDDFEATGEVDMILDGKGADIGIESTVVDITGSQPGILRPGVITEKMIRAAAKVELADAKGAENTVVPRSPGMKYRHYAPKAPMVILKGQSSDVATYILNEYNKAPEGEQIGLLITELTKNALAGQPLPDAKIKNLSQNHIRVAQNLFAQLRDFDTLGVTKIYAEAVTDDGIGVAIMDRMLKAAEGNVVNV